MNNLTALAAIGYTEDTTFNEFCRALGGDCPTERSGWAALFKIVEDCGRQELVTIARDDDGKIGTLRLTAEGAAAVRRFNEERRLAVAREKDQGRGLLREL